MKFRKETGFLLAQYQMPEIYLYLGMAYYCHYCLLAAENMTYQVLQQSVQWLCQEKLLQVSIYDQSRIPPMKRQQSTRKANTFVVCKTYDCE